MRPDRHTRMQWMLLAVLLLLCSVAVQVSRPSNRCRCSLTASQYALYLEEEQLRAITDPDDP
jgi:hypothetical protein